MEWPKAKVWQHNDYIVATRSLWLAESQISRFSISCWLQLYVVHHCCKHGSVWGSNHWKWHAGENFLNLSCIKLNHPNFFNLPCIKLNPPLIISWAKVQNLWWAYCCSLGCRKNNELLLKNLDLRPAGSKLMPEINAIENKHKGKSQDRSNHIFFFPLKSKTFFFFQKKWIKSKTFFKYRVTSIIRLTWFTLARIFALYLTDKKNVRFIPISSIIWK